MSHTIESRGHVHIHCMMLLELPYEVIASIAMACFTGEIVVDRSTLYSLAAVSKGLRRALHAHRETIIDHYTVCHIDDEIVIYRFCGQRHRGGDLPALVREGVYQVWYRFGELHRDGDSPAIINGRYRAWYRKGKPYRDNGWPTVMLVFEYPAQ